MSATPGPHTAAGAVDAEQAVVAVAGREPLLVALDFDGVCAPLVDDPAESRMLPGTREALRTLRLLRRTLRPAGDAKAAQPAPWGAAPCLLRERLDRLRAQVGAMRAPPLEV